MTDTPADHARAILDGITAVYRNLPGVLDVDWPEFTEGMAALRQALAGLPEGMTAEKLEKIADYVSLLDRMTIDLERETVTFHPPKTDETEMQDDLRAWAASIRKALGEKS